MRYDLEESIKSKLYKEFEKNHLKKNITYPEYREYMQNMVRYVQKNFETIIQDEN